MDALDEMLATERCEPKDRWPDDARVVRCRYYTTAPPCHDICEWTDGVCGDIGTIDGTTIRMVAIHHDDPRDLQRQLDIYGSPGDGYLLWDERQFRRAVRHGKILLNREPQYSPGSPEQYWSRPLQPCGSRDCGCSTGVCGRATFGSGQLNYYGYWERPCGVCAEAFARKHPEYRHLVWPPI